MLQSLGIFFVAAPLNPYLMAHSLLYGYNAWAKHNLLCCTISYLS